MQLTQEGHELLTKILETKEIKVVRFFGKPTVMGFQLQIGIEMPKQGDDVFDMAGITFAVDPYMRSYVADMIVDAKEVDGEMTLAMTRVVNE